MKTKVPNMISVKELSENFNFTIRHICNALKDKKIKKVKIGNAFLYPISEIDSIRGFIYDYKPNKRKKLNDNILIEIRDILNQLLDLKTSP